MLATILALTLIVFMAVTSRQSGGGLGADRLPNYLTWLPELFFAIPFGVVFGVAVFPLVGWYCLLAGVLATGWSYIFMQSGTWTFLRWTEHDPNTTRSGTLKPITDWLAGKFGYKLGDEGYSWIAAGVKGFLIGLPVGGLPLAILWPLGYEIGSHARGRVERYGIDPHGIAELVSGAGAGISILLFLAFL